MAPTDYVSDWESLYGAPLPKDGGLHPDKPVEAKVVTAPKNSAPKSKTAEVK